MHINGKFMDKDYTIFHNLHGQLDLSDPYYPIQFDVAAKDICTINISQGLFKMCRLPQGSKISSSVFQNCSESTLKGMEGDVIFENNFLLYGTTEEQFDRRMLAVKSRLLEKNFTIYEKKNNLKPVDSVSFFSDAPFQSREQHQIPNVLKK